MRGPQSLLRYITTEVLTQKFLLDCKIICVIVILFLWETAHIHIKGHHMLVTYTYNHTYIQDTCQYTHEHNTQTHTHTTHTFPSPISPVGVHAVKVNVFTRFRSSRSSPIIRTLALISLARSQPPHSLISNVRPRPVTFIARLHDVIARLQVTSSTRSSVALASGRMSTPVAHPGNARPTKPLAAVSCRPT